MFSLSLALAAPRNHTHTHTRSLPPVVRRKSNAKHAITAIASARVLRESGRRMDVVVLDICVHVADGVCCGQQLHGPNGHQDNERLFGRECPGHTNEWRQLKGKLPTDSRRSDLSFTACQHIPDECFIIFLFVVACVLFGSVRAMCVHRNETSGSPLSIGHRWHRSTIHSAMDAPRHYTSINSRASSFHSHSSS